MGTILAVLGLFGGVLLGLLTWTALVRYLLRRHERRARARAASPKGTRPQIRLEYDGIIFDLSEDLLRLADNDDGFAVWAVIGPPHIRELKGTPALSVEEPMPARTCVKVTLIGNVGGARFATAQEILAKDNPFD